MDLKNTDLFISFTKEIMHEEVNISIACADKVKVNFDQLKTSLVKEEKANIIASHFGKISQDLINGLADTLEDILLSFGEERAKIKRVFSIFIEACRNIRSHGSVDENKEQIAFFIVTRVKTTYQLYFGNLIENKAIDDVNEHVRRINAASLIEIKSMHQASLLSYVQDQKDGSGSGLLIMRLRSYNQITTRFHHLNEHLSLFVVRVDVLN